MYLSVLLAGPVLKCDVFRDAGGSSRVSHEVRIFCLMIGLSSSFAGNGVSV